jgi:glycosyltransferase involved in cell wall biosynthesis
MYTRGLVRRAVVAGHQAEVVACHESPSSSSEGFCVQHSEHEGVPLIEVHFNLSVTPYPARCEYDNPFPARAVAQEIASFRPDVVHVTHALKLSGAAIHACLDGGVPVVVTLCDYWFLCPRHTLLKCTGEVCSGPGRPLKCVPCVRDMHGFPGSPRRPGAWRAWLRDVWAIERRTRYLRDTLLRADLIVALADLQKQLFVANGYPEDRIEVIEHGLEPLEAMLAPVRPAGGSWLRRIGFIGSLVPHKGAHVLLEALARKKQLRVECLVYGAVRPDDAYAQRLAALAREDPRVQLQGAFPPHELGRVLAGLDLLAVPALWPENNPLVVKAALQLGLPILASRLGTLRQMMDRRGPAWLVSAGDPGAWAAALEHLAHSPPPSFPPQPVKSAATHADEILTRYRELVGGCA